MPRIAFHFICVLVALSGLTACETVPETAGPRPALAPGQVIRGGFTGSGGFTPLRGPVAVAAAGADLYVADAGLGQVFRVEPFGNRLTPTGLRASAPGMRLAAELDGSLYLLDPVNRRIQRLSREGRTLQTFATDATVASLRDLALDPSRGRLLAADALNRQIVAFRPLGVSFELLPVQAEPRHTLNSLDAIAVAPEALYALDARCACIARIAFDGRVLATFGHQNLSRPEHLAATRDGRLFVSDRGSRAFAVFRDGALVETLPWARFGITEVTDLAYADSWLYVADAPGAQVLMLRVQPLPKGTP